MVGARTLTALVGLLGSIVLSIVLWWYFESLLVFLFLPFVPFLFKGVNPGPTEAESQLRECPVCGFRTEMAEYEYCPRDGHRLDDRH